MQNYSTYTITNEPAITRVNVDGQEQLPKYYVEELVSPGVLEDIGTKGNLDYVVDLFKPTRAFEKELLNSKNVQALIYL